MQWNASYQESVFSFANNINTHEGGSHLSRLPLGADAHAQQVRAREGPAQGEGRQPLRRGRPRGPDRGHLGQARRPAVRGPDQDQARQPGHARASSSRSSTRGSREFLEENPQEARAVIRKAVAGRAGPRGRAQGARPDAPQVARWRTRACRASSPTARSRTRRWPRSSSSRATPPAARPSRAATATRRRCCRCAARSSTSRRRASTRCSQNNEIQALITAIGTGVRDEFDLEKRALPQGHPDDRRRRRRRAHPHARR